MNDDVDLDALLPAGLGQLTRPFGTAPVDPALGALSLMRAQQRIVAANRFGIPALAHEECLAGFATWGATAYPVPLSWGATLRPGARRARWARRIGADMRSLGVHQGLAPCSTSCATPAGAASRRRSARTRTSSARSRTAYIRGLESAGVVATLKHFVGYSASKGGRNLAPVSIGPRELADVLLPPFEMAIRESGVRSVMNSYTDIDGVATAADPALLTALLRDDVGLRGHRRRRLLRDRASSSSCTASAEDWADAAARGARRRHRRRAADRQDVRPSRCARAVEDGAVDEALVDRALRRVLRQKAELGMLDPDWSPVPAGARGGRVSARPTRCAARVDLDSAGEPRARPPGSPRRRSCCSRNDGTLPLAAPRRIAVIGPTADDPYAVLGCYSFPSHVGVAAPRGAARHRICRPCARRSRRSSRTPRSSTSSGTTVDGGETEGSTPAVAAASGADVVVLALGDRAGLFGRGTSGEGCDAEILDAARARSRQLLDAVLATGTPTVVDAARRPAVRARRRRPSARRRSCRRSSPARRARGAIAGVLSGRVNPSGRLPVSVPRDPGRAAVDLPRRAARAPQRRVEHRPDPAFPFGHGTRLLDVRVVGCRGIRRRDRRRTAA